MAPNNLEISTMTQAFGGLFSSRLNMNLREDKHWAYGAISFSPNSIGERIFVMYAPVQTDKTAPAVDEVLKEARGLVGDHPLTAEEIAKVKNADMRALPGEYESAAAVLGAVQEHRHLSSSRTISCRRTNIASNRRKMPTYKRPRAEKSCVRIR